MPPAVHTVDIPAAPSALHFNQRAQRQLRRAQARLAALHGPLAAQCMQLLQAQGRYNRKRGALRRLEHPLSAHALLRLTEPIRVDGARTVAEAQACARFGPILRAAIGAPQPDQFVRVLSAICAAVRDEPVPLRTTPVGTVPDARGDRWRFPDPEQIVPGLTRLWHYLRSSGAHPIVQAVVAVVMITCIHPFADGNGRTARIVFNALLPVAPSGPYIPCGMLIQLSDLGYQIRLRFVQLRQDWAGLVAFFCDLIEAYYRITCVALRRPARPAPGAPA